MSDDAMRSEKTRICPSCRMQISVLAQKCRFCGEEVGKPKEEQRTLSIHDLGGEQVQHRAPSGSVIDALNSFRVEQTLEEEEAAAESAQEEVFSGIQPITIDDDLIYGDQDSTIRSVHGETVDTFGDRLKTIVFAVIGILVLAFVGVQAPEWINDFRAPPADALPPEFVNRAPDILAQGSLIEALGAAVEAIDHEDSDLNRRIAEDVLDAIFNETNRLLNAVPFNETNLRNASMLATRTADLYPNASTLSMVEEVNEDNRVYRMMLFGIDSGTKTAKFKLLGDNSGEVHVKRGEKLPGDRFQLRTIVGRKSVTLIDLKRGNRVVTYEIGSSPF